MDPDRKLTMFETLVGMGFKEIEVGFPSASQPDYDFVRQLIEEDLVPDDVTIQVLVQCRPELIERTYEASPGRARPSCTSTTRPPALQRRVVFGLDRGGITEIATSAARLAEVRRDRRPGRMSATSTRPKASPARRSTTRWRSARP